MSSSETSVVTDTFQYERPSIVFIQPDVGELEPMAAVPIFIFVAVLAVDVVTWGTAVHTLTKATKSTRQTPTSGPPDRGPTLVTLPGLPAADARPEACDVH
jgi:hypothetical protein